MFTINFTDAPLEYPYDDSSIPAAPGQLVLEGSIEDFVANLSLWQKSDYEMHWRRELSALLNGQPKVALVVSYNDPRAASCMEIWRVYRDGHLAHFQNQYLAYDQLPDPTDISQLRPYISDRLVVNEDGDRISEWDVDLRDIEMFLGQ